MSSAVRVILIAAVLLAGLIIATACDVGVLGAIVIFLCEGFTLWFIEAKIDDWQYERRRQERDKNKVQ
jgi:hypothetical protein